MLLTSLRLSSIFVLHSTLVVSFPKFILPRQEACEGWICPKFDVLPFLDGVSDAAWGIGAAGAAGAGWVIDNATGFLKRPPDEQKSPTTPRQSPAQIELIETAPALEGTRHDQCTATAGSSPDSSSSQVSWSQLLRVNSSFQPYLKSRKGILPSLITNHFNS